MSSQIKLFTPVQPTSTKPIKVLITKTLSSEFIGSSLLFGILDDRNVALKFSQISGGTQREFAGLSLAYINGISVAEPIMLVERDEKPTLGIIMENVSGDTLFHSDSKKSRIALGREIKKLHQIDVPGFGIFTDGNPQFKDMGVYMQSWFDKVLPFLVGDSKELLAELWEKIKPSVLMQLPKFICRDVNDNNAIVNPEGKVTLFDFEWWQGGSPMDDLGIYLYHTVRLEKQESNFTQFLQGYLDEQDLSDNQKVDLFFHTLFAGGRVVSFCARFNRGKLQEAHVDMDKITRFVQSKLKKEN